jgi:hypothetical protein
MVAVGACVKLAPTASASGRPATAAGPRSFGQLAETQRRPIVAHLAGSIEGPPPHYDSHEIANSINMIDYNFINLDAGHLVFDRNHRRGDQANQRGGSIVINSPTVITTIATINIFQLMGPHRLIHD